MWILSDVMLCHRASSSKCSVRTEMPSSSGSRRSGTWIFTNTAVRAWSLTNVYLFIYLPFIQQHFQQCRLNTTKWHNDQWMKWKKTWNFVVDMTAFCFVHDRSQVPNIANRLHYIAIQIYSVFTQKMLAHNSQCVTDTSLHIISASPHSWSPCLAQFKVSLKRSIIKWIAPACKPMAALQPIQYYQQLT